MLAVVGFLVYFAVVLAMAVAWNIGLFRHRYTILAGAFLREPPLFASGMTAIAIQAIAMVIAFGLLYPAGQLDPIQGLKIAFLVNVGSVTYGALVVPGKFAITDVGGWVLIELAYGLLVTILVGAALTAVWSLLG